MVFREVTDAQAQADQVAKAKKAAGAGFKTFAVGIAAVWFFLVRR